MLNFPAYVIHLKERTDRLDIIYNLGYSLNIDLQIYEASDGSEWWEKSSNLKHPWSNDTITKGVVGCAFSHLYLLNYIYKTTEKGILIFEDDTQLVQPSNAIIDYLNKVNKQGNWDIILLGANEYMGSEPITQDIVKVNQFWGAHAMYIKRECIPDILRTFDSYISKGIFLPADWLYNKAIEENNFIVYGPSMPKLLLQQKVGIVSSITGTVRT